MLIKIRHILVDMFSSILIVTVNTLKNGGYLGFKGQINIISFLTQVKNYQLKILQKT